MLESVTIIGNANGLKTVTRNYLYSNKVSNTDINVKEADTTFRENRESLVDSNKTTVLLDIIGPYRSVSSLHTYLSNSDEIAQNQFINDYLDGQLSTNPVAAKFLAESA